MGGVRNPFGGGNIGTTNQIKSAVGINPALTGVAGSVAAAGGLSGLDTSIKDPAGMQQYTDLANQAQAEYAKQRQFMSENVDPQRKSLLAALADQASGKAPSVAEAQLKSAFDTGLKNQLALARSNRGANAGLASRNVSNIAAQQTQNLAQQGAIAKLQEQQSAQKALSGQLEQEQTYGNQMLGAALGSQANVAGMQQAMRDRNDQRNKDLLGAGISIAGKFFGMAKGGKVQYLAEGGQVNSKKEFYKQLKACGGKVQAKAKGGNIDVGDVSSFVKGAEKASASNSDFMSGLMKQNKAPAAAMVAAEGGSVEEEKVQKVSEMDEEAQKIFKEHGSIALQKHLANKKMRQNMYNIPKQDYQKAEGGVMMQAGGVPGQAEHAGDNYANDKVPAMLSPGEVVVPRSVIADGPKAAAHFVEQASKDKNYNAETYAQERPSFIKALKSQKQKESDYESFKKLIKR